MDKIAKYTVGDKDLSLTILNYGATITNIVFKGIDVALGYENIADYFINKPSLGMSVMPNANRIAGSEILINNKKYKLEQNDGNNNLHSHSEKSCQKKMYTVKTSGSKLICETFMADREDLFPGNRQYKIVYELKDNRLLITYSCLSDADTLFNPTQHTYFNLNGHNSGSILNHLLKINAKKYTVNNSELIPTGEIAEVRDTPMDFQNYKTVGQDIMSDFPALLYGDGYDSNWCLNDYDSTLKYCATLKGDHMRMNVYTTQPGLQVYSGNCLSGEIGKGHCIYERNAGIALETQFYPDCCHHNNFASSEIKAGKLVTYQTVYEFEE